VPALRFTRRARRDLNEILDYVAAHDAPAAGRLLTRLQSNCRLLALHPQSGRIRRELGAGVRSFPVKPYVVYYAAGPRRVTVLRILHGARDVAMLL
jgi:toxin ParE1/3/4